MNASFISRCLETAAPASAATTAAVALCGQWEEGNSVAPLNAVSHILWGDSAAWHEEASLKHTASGIALNTMAVASWAAVYELMFGNAARRGNTTAAVLGGISVAGLAYVTDYYLVPRRLTPGFEKRLSAPSMLVVYATLALTLPLASLFGRGK
jgi:hypothetical protein